MNRLWISGMLFAGLIVVIGCGQDGGAPKGKTTPTVAKSTETEHSGWWCNEHGVKESECSMCNPKVAKSFQDKKDWCPMHNRAMSQCFICDPSLREKFAAQYKAKYGKEPPEPADNMPEKDAKKS